MRVYKLCNSYNVVTQANNLSCRGVGHGLQNNITQTVFPDDNGAVLVSQNKLKHFQNFAMEF